MGKICIRCREKKPFDSFFKRAASKDGLNMSCKSCLRVDIKMKELQPIQNLDGEFWRKLYNYEGYYEISNFGRVKGVFRIVESLDGIHRSFKMRIPERLLSIRLSTNGYLWCSITKDHSTKTKFIHRLIAQTFIDNPNGYDIVNHIDGNRVNNGIENLEWCTQSHNVREGIRLKGNYAARGENNTVSKLKEVDVIEIKKLLMCGAMQKKDIARKYNISKSTITSISRCITWAHVSI